MEVALADFVLTVDVVVFDDDGDVVVVVVQRLPIK